MIFIVYSFFRGVPPFGGGPLKNIFKADFPVILMGKSRAVLLHFFSSIFIYSI